MTNLPVHRQLVDGVAVLTMGRPDRVTTLGLDLQRSLLDAILAVGEDPAVRVVVLASAGQAFCVGADLASMQSVPPGSSVGESTAAWMEELTNPIVLALRALPVPVVCAVGGAAAGAGAGLALAGDFVLMARSAYFYLPFLPRLGIVPDMGLTWFLPRHVGRPRAMAMALLGERVGAEQAIDWGLAWAAVDDARLAAEALALARRLAALPPGAALELRRAFDASDRNYLRAQLEYERLRQRELLDREAFAEGVRAFLERRPPVFRAAAEEPGGERRP